MSTPSKARLLEVVKIQCKIFNKTFNPNNVRTGSEILSKPLIGDTVKAYYGDPSHVRPKDLKSIFSHMKFSDPAEEYRLEILASRKRRGKGAPKKKKEADKKSAKK